MKRIISLILTLAVALSLLVLPAGAASTPKRPWVRSTFTAAATP